MTLDCERIPGRSGRSSGSRVGICVGKYAMGGVSIK